MNSIVLRRIASYSIAIVSTAIALLLTLWLEPVMNRTIGSFFYIATIVSAWYGGIPAGIVAIGLSVLALDYFIIPPVYQFTLADPLDLLRLAIFSLVALTLNLLTGRVRASQRHIEQFNQQFAQQTIELTEVNDLLLVALMEQKQAEKELQEYNREVEDLYNRAPCGYHSLDAEGTFVRINDTELNWLGYTRDEILYKKKFSELLTPTSKAIFEENFPRFKQQGWIDNLEFELLNSDGSTRWINLSATAIADDAGNFIMSRSTVFDLGDRKRAEQEQQQAQFALQDSEERLRLALDLTHIGFWDLDLPSGNAIWNDNTFHVMGLSPNEHEARFEVGRNLIHPDDVDWVIQAFEDAIAAGQDFASEYRVVYPDGSVHWLMARARGIDDESGQPVRAIGVLLDITDRKQAEAALRESEEKFRQLADNIQDVFWISDLQTQQILYVSSAYETVWGRRCEDLYCNFNHWLGAIHPDDRSQVAQTFREQLPQGRFSQEYRIIRPDGSMRWIRDRAFPIKTESGITTRLAGIAEDITERHAVEQLKKEFISVVSHELRTPLTAIRGSLGLLDAGLYDRKPERMKEMLHIASTQSDRLVRLVNDILDLERLESGKAKLTLQPCNAALLMEQSIEFMRSQAEQNQIELSVSPLAIEILAAPDSIVQTLTNLLSNAIKFSSAGSTIWMTAKRVDNRAIAGNETPLPLVCFSVKDRGRGIPPDKLDAIFNRFQQVDSSDAREKGGTGLGLAICRTIVQQHGGQIWVESQMGEGSTFFFTIPLTPCEIKNL
jgi:PAS domain S-box-containing protein